MTDGEAMLDVLKMELQSIQGGIRGLDAILFQIKGWCITVTLAVAGVALSSHHSALLWLGAASVLTFWLVDAQYKMAQQIHMMRDCEIQQALAGRNPLDVLQNGSLRVAGLASRWRSEGLASDLGGLWSEFHKPITAGLYLLIACLLVVEALIM